MNHAATSRDELVRTAKRIVQESGSDQLSIRLLAKECGVAVGSVYNYFEDKTELSVAIVASFWKEAFGEEDFCALQGADFIASLEKVFVTADSKLGQNRTFFTSHPSIVGDKSKARGREAMAMCLEQIKRYLLECLKNDPTVDNGIWTEDFTREGFVEFAFLSLLTALSHNKDSFAFLCSLVKKVLYNKLT